MACAEQIRTMAGIANWQSLYWRTKRAKLVQIISVHLVITQLAMNLQGRVPKMLIAVLKLKLKLFETLLRGNFDFDRKNFSNKLKLDFYINISPVEILFLFLF